MGLGIYVPFPGSGQPLLILQSFYLNGYYINKCEMLSKDHVVTF